jgi:hypothetical protein
MALSLCTTAKVQQKLFLPILFAHPRALQRCCQYHNQAAYWSTLQRECRLCVLPPLKAQVYARSLLRCREVHNGRPRPSKRPEGNQPKGT